MSVKESLAGKWQALAEKFKTFRASAPAEVPEEELPEVAAPTTPLGKVGFVIKQIGVWIFRLRKVFMAVPVIYGAFRLAIYNMQNLPEQVGLNLQATGEFAQYIDRNMAVYGPLGVTAACLLLMFCSRRALHPWVISIFTLVLPVLLLLTNMYPK